MPLPKEVHDAKKQLDLILSNLQDIDKFFVLEALIHHLQVEKANVRERINMDSGAFNVKEPEGWT